VIPKPTPEQAVHVLEILEEWMRRGWTYRCYHVEAGVRVEYRYRIDTSEPFIAIGVSHFDALCQATTVMQVLFEEHPEKS
jgi:hypothetical protein